ncbi:MAG: ABC transporter ATP-binding protein/permease [Nevskiaceae bacterium]|jgi:putative ATP-binding cassette transporter|nr:ABC transporter ATP-binding protein/permease [Nevskiaceae bacterium]
MNPASGEKQPADQSSAASTGLRHQLGTLLRSTLRSRAGKAILWLAAGILLVIIATAYGQVRLNQWNKPFYDALSRRDVGDFLYQLGVFLLIAGALLTLGVAQRWLVETLKMRLRDGLVRDLLDHWMRPRRAFWLANSSIGVNPDQRMHEDARKLCDLTADLGTGLLQASILFVTFAGVLWGMSADFTIRFSGVDYAVPGFMLWAAIVYAALGSVFTLWVGRSLVDRNADRYAREADLRFSLVRVNEHLDGISLAGGEADEQRRVELRFGEVLASTVRLIAGLTNLTWVTAGFGWITIVAPILVAAPLYFGGKISFGGLMMAAAAFTQAQGSLRWFVDNFSVLADWRATLLRVASFRDALTAPDAERQFAERIDYQTTQSGCFEIERLRVSSMSGDEGLAESAVTVQQGERVLIVGVHSTERTLLFRALAGLWPWGSGRVAWPEGRSVFFLPGGTPYLPRGTLREALAYPAKVADFDASRYAHALKRLGLARLIPALDEARRWDHELGFDEQLTLSFARILLQQPPWVLIDGTLCALDDEAQEKVIEVLDSDLAGTGIIHIGRTVLTRSATPPRVLHIEGAPADDEVTTP